MGGDAAAVCFYQVIGDFAGPFHLPGLQIELGQLLGDDGGRRVQFQRVFVIVDGFVDVFPPIAIGTRHLGVQMAHGKVEISLGACIVGGLDGPGRLCVARVEGGYNCQNQQPRRDAGESHFELALHAQAGKLVAQGNSFVIIV